MQRPLVIIGALGVAAIVAGASLALYVTGDDAPAPRPTFSAIAGSTNLPTDRSSSTPVVRRSSPSSAIPRTTSNDGSTSGPTGSANDGTPAQTSDEPLTAQDALQAKVPGEHVAYVPDPDAAATWDDNGHVQFWMFTQSGWVKQGSSTFPPLLDGTLDVTGYSLGYDAYGPDKSALVVYVVTGQFTTDAGSGVLLYGPGTNGWGAFENDGTTLASHGRGATTERGAGFFQQVSIGADTSLRTVITNVCRDDLPRYRCGDSTAAQTQWHWSNAKNALTKLS